MITEGDSVADGHSPILYYCDHFSKKNHHNHLSEKMRLCFSSRLNTVKLKTKQNKYIISHSCCWLAVSQSGGEPTVKIQCVLTDVLLTEALA